jgi:5-methylcytosine-specific restriction endonuclease McrA
MNSLYEVATISSRPKKIPHKDAGEIVSPETVSRFGYSRRIGKISNQGQPIYSAHFKHWLWSMQGGRCGYCGDDMAPGGNAQIDHIIPQALGGSHVPPNMMYACTPCNSGKCHRSISEVRNMIRVRRSKVAGVILPKQALALEAMGIDLGLPKTFVFLCELEAWDHVSIPSEGGV